MPSDCVRSKIRMIDDYIAAGFASSTRQRRIRIPASSYPDFTLDYSNRIVLTAEDILRDVAVKPRICLPISAAYLAITISRERNYLPRRS